MSRIMEFIAKRAAVLSRIDAYLEFGLNEVEILEYIIKKYNLTQEEAESYMALYSELFCECEQTEV